jgi:hypothetical protein
MCVTNKPIKARVAVMSLLLLKSFFALSTGDDNYVLLGLDKTLGSHLMIFVAERARRNNSVETVTL